MVIQPVEKTKLSQKITRTFLEKLSDGELKPGQKLPTEMELASSFNVSRNVVRESLKTLELLGIAESKPAKGTFITSNADENLFQYEFWSTLKHNTCILELFEARLAVEPELAYLAALRRTDEDLNKMREFLDGKTSAEYDSYSDFFDSTYTFHLLVAKASKNNIMENFLKNIYSQIKQQDVLQFSVDHSISKNQSSHEKILQQIRQRQPEKAKALMLEHILLVYKCLLE